ncbi:unnamed protein product, partial [Choristocarpus tenellus]
MQDVRQRMGALGLGGISVTEVEEVDRMLGGMKCGPDDLEEAGHQLNSMRLGVDPPGRGGVPGSHPRTFSYNQPPEPRRRYGQIPMAPAMSPRATPIFVNAPGATSAQASSGETRGRGWSWSGAAATAGVAAATVGSAGGGGGVKIGGVQCPTAMEPHLVSAMRIFSSMAGGSGRVPASQFRELLTRLVPAAQRVQEAEASARATNLLGAYSFSREEFISWYLKWVNEQNYSDHRNGSNHAPDKGLRLDPNAIPSPSAPALSPNFGALPARRTRAQTFNANDHYDMPGVGLNHASPRARHEGVRRVAGGAARPFSWADVRARAGVDSGVGVEASSPRSGLQTVQAQAAAAAVAAAMSTASGIGSGSGWWGSGENSRSPRYANYSGVKGDWGGRGTPTSTANIPSANGIGGVSNGGVTSMSNGYSKPTPKQEGVDGVGNGAPCMDPESGAAHVDTGVDGGLNKWNPLSSWFGTGTETGVRANIEESSPRANIRPRADVAGVALGGKGAGKPVELQTGHQLPTFSTGVKGQGHQPSRSPDSTHMPMRAGQAVQGSRTPSPQVGGEGGTRRGNGRQSSTTAGVQDHQVRDGTGGRARVRSGSGGG